MAAGLYPITKCTLQLSGITTMNTAMANVLLASMIGQKSNPTSVTDVFKNVADQIFKAVLQNAEEGQLSKAQKAELEKLAGSYRELLKIIK
jgi:hypothetical protein